MTNYRRLLENLMQAHKTRESVAKAHYPELEKAFHPRAFVNTVVATYNAESEPKDRIYLHKDSTDVIIQPVGQVSQAEGVLLDFMQQYDQLVAYEDNEPKTLRDRLEAFSSNVALVTSRAKLVRKTVKQLEEIL